MLANRTSKDKWFRGTAFLIALTSFLMSFWPSISLAQGASAALEKLERSVAADYPSISHLDPQAFEILKQSGKPLILLDVREADEFAVSHLQSAQRLKPGLSKSRLKAKFSDPDFQAKLKGAHIIFYCSVGVRSSKTASKAQTILKDLGVAGVHNLQGGLFRWHNENRPGLLNARKQATKKIHPYSRRWGRLLTRDANLQAYNFP